MLKNKNGLLVSACLLSLSVRANEIPPEFPFQSVDNPTIPIPSVDKIANQQDLTKQGQPIVTRMPTDKEAGQMTSVSSATESHKPSEKNDESILDAINLGNGSLITIKPKQGVTESVIIAMGKLNRIVTPFSDPKVLTIDNIETKIDGNAIYLATESDKPVNLYISDNDSENSFSLQLVPKNLSTPIEIRIDKQSNGNRDEVKKTDFAGIDNRDSSYTGEIKSIMKHLAKQQIPQGFTLEEVGSDLANAVNCQSSTISFQPGQAMSGHDYKIIIMVGQNISSETTIFDEAFCAGEQVLAIAAWPNIRLDPGEKTEIYILVNIDSGHSSEEARPKLI